MYASGTIKGDTVKAKFTLDEHPDADTLEEYAFGRLPEALSDNLEEHLLLCHRCQGALAEVDEYILLMKYATAQLAPTRVIVTVPPALVAVAVQLVTPEPEIVTAGVAGTESPAAAPSVAVIVLPPISAPVELVTKVEVHVERALTCVGNAAFVTEFATSVAAVIE